MLPLPGTSLSPLVFWSMELRCPLAALGAQRGLGAHLSVRRAGAGLRPHERRYQLPLRQSQARPVGQRSGSFTRTAKSPAITTFKAEHLTSRVSCVSCVMGITAHRRGIRWDCSSTRPTTRETTRTTSAPMATYSPLRSGSPRCARRLRTLANAGTNLPCFVCVYVVQDFGKPGVESARPLHGFWLPRLEAMWTKSSPTGWHFLLRLGMANGASHSSPIGR